MKKLFFIFLGAAALSFQACKEGTSDKDKTIDDGMHSSETSVGTGSTRPSDRDPNNAGKEGPTNDTLNTIVSDTTQTP